jgi:glycine/serine hydroxymethyltransferase
VNVQSHSDSQANMAVYFTVLAPGDSIMKEPEMDAIAGFIDRTLRARGDQKTEASVRADVASLAGQFPLYPERLT